MLVRYCDLCKKEICRGVGGTVRTPEVIVMTLDSNGEYHNMDICYECSCKLNHILYDFKRGYTLLKEVLE
jgi:hypothetical protein